MTYYTKYCPFCRFKYLSHSPTKRQYGSPFRTCSSCGQKYIDKDYIEMALQDPSEYSVSHFSALTIIGLIIFSIFAISSIPLDYSYAIFFGIIALLFIYFLYSEYKDYPNRVKWQEEELEKSKQRCSNPYYILALLRIKYKVPSQIVDEALLKISNEEVL